jgi:hypothetical protein
MLLVFAVVVVLGVEYLLVEEDRNEKFVVKLSVCVCGKCCKRKNREKGKKVMWLDVAQTSIDGPAPVLWAGASLGSVSGFSSAPLI